MSDPDKASAIEAQLQTATDPREKVDLLNALASELWLPEPRRALEISLDASRIAQEQSYEKGLAKALQIASGCYSNFSEHGQSIACTERALELFRQLGDSKSQAASLNTLGIGYLRQGLYPKALDLLMASIALARNAEDPRTEAHALCSVGVIYQDLGEYETALDYYFKSYRLMDQIHDYGASVLISNIGAIYVNLKNYPQALEYYSKALELLRASGDSMNEGNTLNNIGETYIKLKEFDKALECLAKSYELSKQAGYERIRGFSLMAFGSVYRSLKRYDQASQAYGDSLTIARKIGEKNFEVLALLGLGQVCSEQGKYPEAIAYLKQSLALAEEQKTIAEQAQSHEALAGACERRNDHQSALAHYRKFHELDKQAFNEGSDKKRQMLMVQFQVERAEKEAEIFRLKNVDLAEANRQITEAKEEIEGKNKQITDSIHYAQRIQAAVMPPEAELREALPEHFVLFRPRDIVSGDFYWYSRRGGKLLVAVVDCTGHGVPGAFMSMIGTMLLNQIVNERGIESPGKILEELHLAVRQSLNQGSGQAEANDGMDACLCSFRPGRAVFAGAKRPLYHARPSGLTVVAGSRAAIGGTQKEGRRTFSETEIAVQAGDMLYLTTDGYADQPDGEGRRFGSKRLEEVLRSVWGLGVSEQQLGLTWALDDHQGAAEQRDDIAVMGLRI